MISSSKEKTMKVMAFASLMVFFIIGAVVGVLGTNWYNRTHQQVAGPAGPRPGGGRRPGGPGGGPGGSGNPDKFIEKLQVELNLTDQQAKQMKDIMSKTRDQFMQLRDESRPKYIAIREQSEKDIKAILTPEQQTKLEAFFKQGERDRDRERGDREHGDRGDREHDKEGSQRPH